MKQKRVKGGQRVRNHALLTNSRVNQHNNNIITTIPIKKEKRRGGKKTDGQIMLVILIRESFLFMLFFSTDIVTECHLYSKAEIRFMAHLQIERWRER